MNLRNFACLFLIHSAAESAPDSEVRRFKPYIPTGEYSPPVIFIDEPRHDFGTVFDGETIQHRFWIENKGGAPLVIKKVRPICGSPVGMDNIDKVIAPGAKGSLELKIWTSGFHLGRLSKYFDIITNDPKRPTFRVYFQGIVEALIGENAFIRMEPLKPRIVILRGSAPTDIEINFTRVLQKEVNILDARAKSDHLVLTLKEIEPGSAWKLLAKTNYPVHLTQSYFSERIDLDLQVGKRKLSQSFNISVQLKNRIETTPRMVYFRRSDFQPLIDKGTPAVKTVDILATPDPPYEFKITSFKADSPDPFFRLSLIPVKEGRGYRLTVTVDKMPELPVKRGYRSLKGKIKLSTNDPEQPEINLRCVAFF